MNLWRPFKELKRWFHLNELTNVLHVKAVDVDLAVNLQPVADVEARDFKQYDRDHLLCNKSVELVMVMVQ